MSQKLKVAFQISTLPPNHSTFEYYLEEKHDPSYRIIRMMADAMRFEFEIVPENGENKLLPNGSWTGVMGMLNRSEVDIATNELLVTEERIEAMRFLYPFTHSGTTFIIEKTEYSPQMFGLAKALSLPVWTTLVSFMITMVALKYMLMKRKYSFSDVFLHVFATCLGESSHVKPWTMSQTMLNYSWMVGTIFLSFCYSSVLLSFLTFPTILEITDMQSLARETEKNGYNCMYNSVLTAGPLLLLTSGSKHLKQLGENMHNNPNCFGKFDDFIRLKKQKIAFFTLVDWVPFLPYGYFVSKDHVIERISGMAVRKDFCCAKKLDQMVNRIMATGLYSKVKEDSAFLTGLMFRNGDSNNLYEQKLTLTDLFLPFMILLFGCTVSVMVLIAEILSSKTYRKGKKRKKMRSIC